MFLVSNADGIIGMCDSPRWVKQSNSGSLVQCKQEDAEYLAFLSKLYDCNEVAIVGMDAGEIAFDNQAMGISNEAGLYDVADLASQNSDAFFDIAEYAASLEERISALEGGK